MADGTGARLVFEHDADVLAELTQGVTTERGVRWAAGKGSRQETRSIRLM
jgi:hypothetical protein